MNSTWTHKVKMNRYLPEGERVSITAGLHQVGNKERPHFSLTYEMSNGSGGAGHELIVGLVPELALIAALHLSTDDGVPMHAVANAAYWLGFTKWESANFEIVAKHLRVTVEEAEAIEAACRDLDDPSEGVAYFVDVCRPRWQAEAEAGVKLLDELAVKV